MDRFATTVAMIMLLSGALDQFNVVRLRDGKTFPLLTSFVILRAPASPRETKTNFHPRMDLSLERLL